MREREWVSHAISTLNQEIEHAPETPMRRFPLPAEWGIDLYLKDESAHPSGSLKHRLAHSLIQFGLVNGDIIENVSLVEASSGSTAVSEAFFARKLGLRLVAVVPAHTSREKLALIKNYGAQYRLMPDNDAVYAEAERLGAQSGWFYLDQFRNASVATDWRAPRSIAYSIFDQLSAERYPEPDWIVVGAGTGGTSASIGRYCRYRGARTQLAVVDPEGSAFYRAWTESSRDVTAAGSRIEGIGRPRVEPSFVPTVIDEMIQVPDDGSVAAMQLMQYQTGLSVGPSTGTNLFGALQLVGQMRATGRTGSIVTLICDSGARYLDTFHSVEWRRSQGLSGISRRELLTEFLNSGEWLDKR